MAVHSSPYPPSSPQPAAAGAVPQHPAPAALRCAPAVLSVCPQLLSKSVDDQLQPLADLVEGLGGCPRTLLLAYPPLAEVPVDHLRYTRAGA